MPSLDQLPTIVQHQILDYLPYEALLALRQVSRHFRAGVEDQVIQELKLPLQEEGISVITRPRIRPVLDLAVILRLGDIRLEDELFALQLQLDKFNLSKVGSLTVKLEPQSDEEISWENDYRLLSYLC